MSASQRRKGANAERAVVAWLRANGYPDARRYLAGDGRQPGDIDVWPGICIEVKDRYPYDIPGALRQAEEEAGRRVPVVVMHPRGVADVADWWAVMSMRGLLELMWEDA